MSNDSALLFLIFLFSVTTLNESFLLLSAGHIPRESESSFYQANNIRISLTDHKKVILINQLIPSVVGEIAKLKGNATPNAIARWREIKAYEVSATELFGAGKSTQRGDVHHL